MQLAYKSWALKHVAKLTQSLSPSKISVLLPMFHSKPAYAAKTCLLKKKVMLRQHFILLLSLNRPMLSLRCAMRLMQVEPNLSLQLILCYSRFLKISRAQEHCDHKALNISSTVLQLLSLTLIDRNRALNQTLLLLHQPSQLIELTRSIPHLLETSSNISHATTW